MTREIIASAEFTSETAAAMALQRMVPTRTLPDLMLAVKNPGPVQRAIRHIATCAHCLKRARTSSLLCRTGAVLAAKSAPQRPRRRRRAA